jgi:hypothetical protein
MLAPMKRALAFVAVVAMGEVLTGCCGYGGPGCGIPALEGICEARLAVDQTVVATAVYFDDTGSHPAEIHSAETLNPAVLGVSLGPTKGELSLTGNASGKTGLALTVGGWDGEVFTWSFAVQEDPAPVADECAESLAPDPAE